MATEPAAKASPDSRYLPDFPEQVLYPEYAIGQKLITRDEYDQLEATYVTQAQAAFGLILPLVLLVAAISYSGLLALPWWSYPAIGVLLLVVAWVGMDRLHMFNSRLQQLIVSRWDAVQAAKQAADAAAAGKQAADAANAKLLASVKHDVDDLKKVTQELKLLLRRRGGGLYRPPDDTPPEQTPSSTNP